MLGQRIGDQRPGDDVGHHRGNTRPTGAPHLPDWRGAEDLAPEVMAEEPPYEHDDDPGDGDIDKDDGERHNVAPRRQAGQVDVKDAAVMLGNADLAPEHRECCRRCPDDPAEGAQSDRMTERRHAATELVVVGLRGRGGGEAHCNLLSSDKLSMSRSYLSCRIRT